MKIFLEGGEANGHVIDVSEKCTEITFPSWVHWGEGITYIMTHAPFRLFSDERGVFPVFIESQIELPAERLEILKYL